MARGRNFASKFAQGEILFYLDDDVNLKDKKTLQKISHSFYPLEKENRKIGVVSFKVYYSSTMEMQINAFAHKNFKEYKNKQTFLTYYYAGCAHAKLKQAWNDAGPYPEDFFYGMEEYDFSYRVLNAGYCIKYDDSVVVYHKESPLGRNTKVEKLRMMWVNKSKVSWRYLPKRFFYSTAVMWGFYFLINSGFNIKNFLKGWKEILYVKRKEIRSPIKSKTLEYLKRVKARLWH